MPKRKAPYIFSAALTWFLFLVTVGGSGRHDVWSILFAVSIWVGGIAFIFGMARDDD